MKKALIFLVIGLPAITGWFACSRFSSEVQTGSPLDLVTADATLVLHFRSLEDFQAISSDTASALAFLPASETALEIAHSIEGSENGPFVLAGYATGTSFEWIAACANNGGGPGDSLSGPFHRKVYRDYQLLSSSRELIQQIQKAGDENTALLSANPSFQSARKSLTSEAAFYVYAHPGAWLKWFTRNWSPTWQPVLQSLQLSQEWIAFDANVGDREITLHGISVGNAPGNIIRDDQKVKTSGLAHILPSSTIGLVHMSPAMSAPFHAEFALVVTSARTKTKNWNEHTYLIFPGDSAMRAHFEFQSAGIHGGHEIYSSEKQPASDSLRAILPEWQQPFYATLIGSYIVTGHSRGAIQDYLDSYLSDNTLGHDKLFQTVKPRLTDAGFTLLFRPDLAASYLAHKTQNTDSLADPDAFADLNMVALQVAREQQGQVFYSIQALHHRDVFEPVDIAWKTQLDTAITGGPWKFLNHNTGEWEIAVQDAMDRLYLLDGRGKLLWKRELKAPVVADLQVVDLFGNGKYQMLFNTPSHLYLIDRNGKDVNGFPVELDKASTAAVARFDYSGKSEPRLLVNSGVTLLNLDKNGKEVQGWTNPGMDSTLAGPVQHMLVNGKDYLVAHTHKNSVYFFDRTGKERAGKIAIAPARNSYVRLIKGSSFEKSYLCYADSLGNVHKTYLTGQDETHNVLPSNSELMFDCRDLDKKPGLEMLCVSENGILMLDQEYDVLLVHSLPSDLSKEYRQVSVSPSENAIGLHSGNSGEIYMLSPEKLLYAGFPLRGNSLFLLEDFDGNGRPELIVGTTEGKVISYPVEF